MIKNNFLSLRLQKIWKEVSKTKSDADQLSFLKDGFSLWTVNPNIYLVLWFSVFVLSVIIFFFNKIIGVSIWMVCLLHIFYVVYLFRKRLKVFSEKWLK